MRAERIDYPVNAGAVALWSRFPISVHVAGTPRCRGVVSLTHGAGVVIRKEAA